MKKNLIFAALAFALLGLTAASGLAQTGTYPVITKTSTAAIVITATSGQRIEMYSMTPQAGSLPESGNTVYPAWKLVSSGLTLSSPFTTGTGIYAVYNYSTIPSVVAGPATLTVTPASATKVVSVSYSVVPN